MRASGLNRTFVPCLSVFSPVSMSEYLGMPPLTSPSPLTSLDSNSMRYVVPLRKTSTVSHSDSALVTDAPTPCKPPECA